MLTSKERAELRAQANTLETTLIVGKSGVTDTVIGEAENQLTARELVKGKVLEGALMSPREVSDAACLCIESSLDFVKSLIKVADLASEVRIIVARHCEERYGSCQNCSECLFHNEIDLVNNK